MSLQRRPRWRSYFVDLKSTPRVRRNSWGIHHWEKMEKYMNEKIYKGKFDLGYNWALETPVNGARR